MPQQMDRKKILSDGMRMRYVATLLILLFFSALTAWAQRPVCLPINDLRVYLASRGAIYLPRSAKKSRQQNHSTQQAWKASKDSTGAAKNEPVNTKDLWSATKSAADTEAKIAPSETNVARNEAMPVPEIGRQLTPVELLASARTIYIKSNSVWVKRKSIEDALMKKKGFLELGYAIVKDLSEADLKLEVDHTALTLRYPFTVTHMKSQIVVASGTVISLRILNDVPGDTAGSFVKQAKAARTASVTAPKK